MFEETAREVVPGAVAECIDAWGFVYEPMAQTSLFPDRKASRTPLIFLSQLAMVQLLDLELYGYHYWADQYMGFW